MKRMMTTTTTTTTTNITESEMAVHMAIMKICRGIRESASRANWENTFWYNDDHNIFQTMVINHETSEEWTFCITIDNCIREFDAKNCGICGEYKLRGKYSSTRGLHNRIICNCPTV